MWPTFYLPSLIRFLGRITGIVGLCGRDDTPPNPYTVVLDLTDLALQDGDLLLMFMYAADDGTAGAQTPTWCDEVSDWKPIKNGSLDLSPPTRVLGSLTPSADALFTGANTVRTAVAWRFWRTGDPTTYTFNNDNDLLSVCIYGIRGAHQEDPFPWICFYPGSNGGGAIQGSHGMPPNPMPYVEGCARLDVAQYSNATAAGAETTLEVPEGDDILFYGYELPFEDGSGTIDIRSGSFYVLRYPVAGEANNLLPYSTFEGGYSAAGWTIHGMTCADTTLAGISYNRVSLAVDAVVQAREFRRSFTCEAGKYYCLWSIRDTQAIAATQGYLRDGTFHGARFNLEGNRLIVDGSDTIRPAEFTVAFEDGADRNGYFRLYLLWFGGFETDTDVDLVLGYPDVSTPFAREWAIGLARASNMHAIGLAEVPSMQHVPALIENTTGAALTGVNMTHGAHIYPVASNFTTTNTAFSASQPTYAFTLMIRAAGKPAPTIDLRQTQWIPHDFNHLSATEFEEYKTGFKKWSMARRIDACSAYAHCPRPAIPNMGHDKLYCEYTIEAIGSSSGTPSDPWVYVQTVGDGAEHAGADKDRPPRSALALSAQYSTAAWGILGRFSEFGTSASGFTGFSAGDILGVGVNYADGEVTWYKNGTLVRTTTMDTDRTSYWLGTGIAFGEGSRTNHFPQITVNWTGPFGGRKPAGFEAWDWPNEVT